MIEIRWVVPAETSTKPPVLQFRYSEFSEWSMIPLGSLHQTDWQDVPTVVLPKVAPEGEK